MSEGRLRITVFDDLPTRIDVTVTPDRKEVQVAIDGLNRDPREGGSPTGVRRSRVKKVLITGGAEVDTIAVGLLDDLSPRRQRRRFIARAIIFGGGGDDVITGGPQSDVIIGGPGNDRINGGDRNDLIFGGTGNDEIDGGLAKDNLFGQDGNDFLYGGPGDDALYGMAGDDTLAGGLDADFFNGGPGTNTLLDGNDEPGRGADDDVPTYMGQLVHLGVPQGFRSAVFT